MNINTHTISAGCGSVNELTAGSLGIATVVDLGAAKVRNLGVITRGAFGEATAGDVGIATIGTLGEHTTGSFGEATAGDSWVHSVVGAIDLGPIDTLGTGIIGGFEAVALDESLSVGDANSWGEATEVVLAASKC